MKRKNFEIYLDGKLIETKHAWNAVLRFIRSHIRQHMTGDNAKIDYQNVKKCEQNRDCINGMFLWGDNIGNAYKYEIKLID